VAAWARGSTNPCKKVTEQSAALHLPRSPVEARARLKALLKEVEYRPASTHGRVFRSITDNRDAGVDNGAGAHRTRLQCDIKCSPLQAPAAHIPASLPNGKKLRVAQSVAIFFPPVPALSNDTTVLPDKDTAHRDFSMLQSLTGQLQGPVHIRLVRHCSEYG